jgi:hypothetical protein
MSGTTLLGGIKKVANNTAVKRENTFEIIHQDLSRF